MLGLPPPPPPSPPPPDRACKRVVPSENQSQMDIASGLPHKGRSMTWGQVIGIQDWLQLIVAVIAVAIAAGLTSSELHERPFLVGNPAAN